MQSNENLDSFYALRRMKIKKSVKDLYENKIGKEINFGELGFLTVINMICGMFWGGTINEEEEIIVGEKFRAAAMELVEILGRPNVSDFFPFLARFDIQRVEKKMKKVSERIEKIYDYVIEKYMKKKEMKESGREENDNGRKDFLNFLLEFKDQESGRSISKEQIKALLMDIVIGGTDTSSTTIEWALAEMMLHPQVLTKVQQELTAVIGINNVVEEFQIQKLPYLHAVIKETLRLHPVAPLLLPRSPRESCNIGGYIIPKNTKVFLNVWGIHRDPKFWDNPTEFRPERFMGNDKLDYFGNYLHYIPFGSGRRICAGLPLGERMVMYVLATYLHMFNWKLPTGVKPDTLEKFGIVLEKFNPLIVIPNPRLSNSELYA